MHSPHTWNFNLVELRVEPVRTARPDGSTPADSSGRIAVLELQDPRRRNALGEEMFRALREALHQVAALTQMQTASTPTAVLLCGQGPAFCGGFDLDACVQQPARLREFVQQLSTAVRALRALPVPVIAQVQGAALAGGCALLAGCDFVFAAADAQLGYPVHRIGVSPAVTLPALLPRMGAGRAREITMGGALYTGAEGVRVGLVTGVVADADNLSAHCRAWCARLAAKGPHALRATKAWLNELDGLDETRTAHATAASAAAADGDEFATLLRAFWQARQTR